MIRRTILAVGTSAGALLCAGVAQAQDVGEAFARDRNVSVRERPREDYEALGVRAGSFMILPKVTASLTYDDNIYAREVNEVSDVIATLVGEAQAFSNWNNHDLGGFIQIRRDEFLEQDSESVTTGRAQYERAVEPRTGSGVLITDEPVRYDSASAEIGAARAFNRLRIRGNLSWREYDFDRTSLAGVPISQDYRDHTYNRLIVRGDYAFSPDTAFFLEARTDDRDYDLGPPLVGLDRDSEGREYTVGANFDLSNLARGEVQIGHLEQDFRSPAVEDISGLTGRARVEFFPTPLVTLTFRAAREIGDSGIVASPAFSAVSYGAQADYEFRRNVIITARLDRQEDTFQGIDRKDERLAGSVGAVYLMNRRVGLSVLYTHYNQDSSGVARGPRYDVNRVSASLVLQY
jgi:hypothetical protein